MIVNNFGLNTEQKKDVDVIMSTINNHNDDHRDESMKQHALHQWVQQPGKSFDNYLIDLW